MQETVVHGQTGLHVPPGDVSALISALNRICGDEPLRERFSRAASRRARAHYTWDQTASRLADTYAAVGIGRTQTVQVWS
jgi:glycosyltransferase involved in cell wall biosynthesis